MASIPFVAFDEIDSTNTEARRRAESGDIGPMWITASKQTAGRGRRGRDWESPGGNLAATLFFTTERPPAEIAQLSFIAALAVADLACNFVPPALVTVKWPNDVMIDGSKTAGILVESSAPVLGKSWVAVGIGVNLAHAPSTTLYPATAFASHMRAPPPMPLDALEVLSDAYERWLAIWEKNGFPPIAEAWTTRAHGLGQPCTANLPNESIDGIAEGLDPDGAFRLRVAPGKTRRIFAGDVFFGRT